MSARGGDGPDEDVHGWCDDGDDDGGHELDEVRRRISKRAIVDRKTKEGTSTWKDAGFQVLRCCVGGTSEDWEAKDHPPTKLREDHKAT